MYDYIIIGAGPSGLYTAKRLEEKYGSLKILIIEKEKQIGGRTRQSRFHSKLVVTGAGVGRYPKDKLLYRLLETYVPNHTIKIIENPLCYQMSHPIDTLDVIHTLKKKRQWIQKHRATHTFKQFFLHFYSTSFYSQFCHSNGFTDFENADIVDTLYDYGFEDNRKNQKIFIVPWNQLFKKLRNSLCSTKISFQDEMISFHKNVHHFIVVSKKGPSYATKNLIFAGSLITIPYPKIRKAIRYQPFLRLYVYLKTQDPLHTKGTYYKDNELQKSIVITPKIQLLSYSDNEHAVNMFSKSKSEIENISGIKIQDMRKFYWKEGTHFYPPLNTKEYKHRDEFIEFAQHPEPNVFIVGEMISKNQGWTEGALESVERIYSIL